MLQNDSYLHHQSSVLFAFKICFDQIFVVGIFFFWGGGRFQQKMQLWPGYVFKLYATHFLMWPPLWYNSKLAKSIPLFSNPYPFIQKSHCGYVFIQQLLCNNYFYPQICINDIFVCSMLYFGLQVRCLNFS